MVVDTNLLLLFLAGTARDGLIASHARLRSDYDQGDFELLCALMAGFESLVSLLPIIVETDYFANETKGTDRYLILSRLREFVLGTPEYPTTCERGITSTEFARLGFVDSLILETLAEAEIGGRDLSLLSNDAPLVNAACSRGLSAVLFRELRTN